MNYILKFRVCSKVFFLSNIFILFFNFSLFANDFEIVAKINSTVITQYDLDNYSKIINIFFDNDVNPIFDSKNSILNNLIETTLKNEAIIKEKIVFDPIEFKYYLNLANENNKNVEKYLKNNYINKESYEDMIKNSFMWNKLIEAVIKPRIKVNTLEVNDSLEYLSDGALRSRYEISQIILYGNKTSNSGEIANKLYKEISEKNNFESIAEKILQNDKKNKGYVGWVDSMDINKNIYDAIKNLEKGKITKPLYFGDENSGYYIIVKLNDKKQELVAKNEDISRVFYFIYNQKLNLEIKNYIDILYKNALIEIY